jgi:hypothetical protein
MAMHELKRTHYDDAADSNINHDTRDHRQDMTHYHVPLMRMHQAALHGWGIAVGLQVSQTGEKEVTIAEGLAIDIAGRMLPLAAQGQTPGQPGKAFIHDTAPGHLVDVPVVVSAAGLIDGTYYVTLELATTNGPEGPVEGRWLPQEGRIVSTPVLKLQPTAGFTADGTAVILATVALVGGAVTQLSGAERQLVELAAGAVVVRRGGEGEAESQVGDAESGRIGPLAAGGLAIEVPGVGDQVVVQRAGAQTFEALTVRADHLRVEGDVEVSGTVNGQDVSADAEAFAAHAARTDNPHQVTAAQIDTQGGTNKLVAQLNASTGVINEARIDAAIARDIELKAHMTNRNNPHQTTAVQVGALPTTGGTIRGNLKILGGGTTYPFQLSLGNSLGRTKLALYETDASNAYGLGISAGMFRLHLNGPLARFAFFDSDEENAREIVTITGNGDIRFRGNLMGGGKGGYVMDQFVNGLGETLEQGDVIVVGDNQTSLYYDSNNNIPIPEVEVAQRGYDTRVCGIVCEVYGKLRSEDGQAANPGTRARKGRRSKLATRPQAFLPEELEKLDRTKVESGQIGWMVTLGAFAHCKVDADFAAIKAGDLLTTSPTKGHAQKVLDPSKAVGAILGKALGSLHKGQGKIPVLVLLH